MINELNEDHDNTELRTDWTVRPMIKLFGANHGHYALRTCVDVSDALGIC